MRYDYTNSMNRGDYPYGESNEYCENDNRYTDPMSTNPNPFCGGCCQGPTGPTGALYLGKVTVCKNAVSIKPPRYGY